MTLSNSLPVHGYEGPARYGNCAAIVRDQAGKRRRCNRQQNNPVHRHYPCRVDGCVDLPRWRSVEARDRHEANAHGEGW